MKSHIVIEDKKINLNNCYLHACGKYEIEMRNKNTGIRKYIM